MLATPGVIVYQRIARRVQYVVFDLVVPFCKALPVLLYVERFGPVFEVDIGFKDDEVVDLGCELAETDFHPVQLRIDHEKIINLSFLVPVRVRFPPPCLAVMFCFFKGKEVWGIGCTGSIALADNAQYISCYCRGAAEEVYGGSQQSCCKEVPVDRFE